MKKACLAIITVILLVSCSESRKEFLRAQGNEIVNASGEDVLLKGIGLGGWMLQEPYMLMLSDAAANQTDIRRKIAYLAGEESCADFYDRYLENMITKRDIDSLKGWGFNSIRLPMHYNLFTLPADNETDKQSNTWIEKGFKMTDELLSWCKSDSIYLILDLHAAPGGQGNDIPIADVDTMKPRLWQSRANQNKTVALWRKLAERYKDEPWIGGYDLLNETNYKLEGNEMLRKLFVRITDTIREVDINHIIFIEGNGFANDFTGLTPPWDSNMVYSFHKYWNPPEIETIRKYLDLRDEFNIPLWMGESGENNNEWYKAAVNLLEQNSIGWSWWTIKKLKSDSGIMTVRIPAGYQEIIDYWEGKGPAPSKEKARSVLMQLAENMKIENCSINYPVIEALTGYKH